MMIGYNGGLVGQRAEAASPSRIWSLTEHANFVRFNQWPTSYDLTHIATYTGTGVAQSIGGIPFGAAWILPAVNVGNWPDAYALFTQNLGATKYISSGLNTSQPVTDAQSVTSFGASGLNLGTSGVTNSNGREYDCIYFSRVAAPYTNNAGSLASTVYSGGDFNYSLVQWTGNGVSTGTTIGHGLSAAPVCALIGSNSRYFSVQDIPANTSNLIATNNTYNGDMLNATSTTVQIGGNVNNNNYVYTALFFAPSQSNFQRIGYTGNNAASLTISGLTFRPKLIICMCTQFGNDSVHIWNPLRQGFYGGSSNGGTPNNQYGLQTGAYATVTDTSVTFTYTSTQRPSNLARSYTMFAFR